MASTVGIKFLYNFSVGQYDYLNPGSNIISVTSEADGDHSKTNLTTTPLRETWRSNNSIAGFQDIIIQANDLADAPDTFALLNHNLSDIAVVQLQGSMTVSFASPAFTVSIPWSKKHMVYLQDLGIAYPYYRIRILDPTNPCGFIEVGRIVAGTSFTFTNNEDIVDDFSINTEDLAYKMKTEGFFRAFNERVQVDKLNINFSKLITVPPDDTNYVNLRAMLEEVGETNPFLTILDPEDQTFSILWGIVDSLPNKSYTINRYVSMGFSIQEVY